MGAPPLPSGGLGSPPTLCSHKTPQLGEQVEMWPKSDPALVYLVNLVTGKDLIYVKLWFGILLFKNFFFLLRIAGFIASLLRDLRPTTRSASGGMRGKRWRLLV